MTTRTVSTELTPAQRQAFEEAVERYGKSFFANVDLIWKTLLGAAPQTEDYLERAAEAAFDADFRIGSWAEWSEIDETDRENKRLKDQYRAYARAALSAAPKGGA